MVFWDFFEKILQFDIVWILQFVLINIHWVFAFIVLAYFLFPKKNILFAFLIVVSVAWFSSDFATSAGWSYAVGGFLAFNYFSRMVIAIITEDIPQLQNKLPTILVIQFIVCLIFFNIFLR